MVRRRLARKRGESREIDLKGRKEGVLAIEEKKGKIEIEE